MKPGWMAAMTLATAAATTLPCRPTLLVTLENGQLAGSAVLGLAQGVATRIFARIGVRLVWRTGALDALIPCAEALRIILDENAPPNFSPSAMAYATVGGARTAIHVFYRRLAGEHTRQLTPMLLGHVFAHEIVHALEDVARHSPEGVLKAHWTQSDFNEMARGPLPLDPVDAELVLARFSF